MSVTLNGHLLDLGEVLAQSNVEQRGGGFVVGMSSAFGFGNGVVDAANSFRSAAVIFRASAANSFGSVTPHDGAQDSGEITE